MALVATTARPARPAFPGAVPTTIPAAPHDAGRARWHTSTPGRMVAALTGLLLIGAAFGAAGALAAGQRDARIAHIRSTTAPLQVAAESLYRSLSDADATEAAAFLAAGAEPATLRSRYLDDIGAASDALARVSAGGTGGAALRQLDEGLPIYTGLVETARADNRLGLPLGAAYLREASGEMRTALLPAAVALYQAQTSALHEDSEAAQGAPWPALGLGLLAMALLVWAQRALYRRTHRVINLGLAAGTLALTAAFVWLAVASHAAAADLHTGDVTGSARVGVLTQARIDALKARADESLTLVARGNDPSFDADYAAMTKALAGGGGPLAQALTGPDDPALKVAVDGADDALTAWGAADAQARQADAQGGYAQAVAVVTGAGPDDEPALFAAADSHLDAAIDTAESRFTAATGDAAGAIAASPYGVAVLTLLGLAAITLGYRARIVEYR